MLKWMVSNRAGGPNYLKVEDDQVSESQKDVEKGVFTITRYVLSSVVRPGSDESLQE